MPWLEKFSSSLWHKPQFILYSSQYYRLFTHVSCGGNCWGVSLLNSCRSSNVFPCLFAASDYHGCPSSEWMAELWVWAGVRAPREWGYRGSTGNGCEQMKGWVSLQVSPGAGEWLQVREGWMQAGGGREVWKREVGEKGSQIPERGQEGERGPEGRWDGGGQVGHQRSSSSDTHYDPKQQWYKKVKTRKHPAWPQNKIDISVDPQ